MHNVKYMQVLQMTLLKTIFGLCGSKMKGIYSRKIAMFKLMSLLRNLLTKINNNYKT